MVTVLSRRHALAVIAAASTFRAESLLARMPRPIDERGFVRIRGDDVANPALVLLHGDPEQTASWRREYTIVDQELRGASDESLDRLSRDAYEVVLHACKRLRKRQVVLVGHSIGAALGLEFVRRWPYLVSTFVATGLPGDGLPYRTASSAPTRFDPLRVTRRLEVPLLIVQGRDDRVAPGELSRHWFRQVRAPKKGYSTIDGGHFACFTNPTEFLDALRRFA